VGPESDAAGIEDAGGAITDAASCGVATIYIMTPNPTVCLPCIQQSCCLADQACSVDPSSPTGCVVLLMCMESCEPTNAASCLGQCENSATTGITPYNDLANCIAQNCNPQCQALPQTTPSEQ
jgi:hypothetical protein